MNTPIRQIIVHDGTFHADDVLCVAMAQLTNPNVIVKRMSHGQLPLNIPADTIVADVGFGKYDHHQADAKLRDDGQRFAACGLLLQDLEQTLFGGNTPSELIAHIRRIEDHDNKVPESREDFLSQFVRLSNPEWDESESKASCDALFEKAVEYVKEYFLKPYLHNAILPDTNKNFFTKRIFELSLKHTVAEQKASTVILKALCESDGQIVVLPSRLPWYNFLIASTALFVINPSNRGGFHLQCIPTNQGANTFKLLLPTSWLTTYPPGCSFVHNRLFIAAFVNENKAVAAARKIIRDLNAKNDSSGQ